LPALLLSLGATVMATALDGLIEATVSVYMVGVGVGVGVVPEPPPQAAMQRLSPLAVKTANLCSIRIGLPLPCAATTAAHERR
jgi:hypothetical protein